jgi:hypothetical protein
MLIIDPFINISWPPCESEACGSTSTSGNGKTCAIFHGSNGSFWDEDGKQPCWSCWATFPVCQQISATHFVACKAAIPLFVKIWFWLKKWYPGTYRPSHLNIQHYTTIQFEGTLSLSHTHVNDIYKIISILYLYELYIYTIIYNDIYIYIVSPEMGYPLKLPFNGYHSFHNGIFKFSLFLLDKPWQSRIQCINQCSSPNRKYP